MEQPRIKIGYFVNYFVPGGMEKFILMLINQLDRGLFKPHIYIHYKSDPAFLGQLKPDVKIVHLHRRSGRDVSSWVRMIRQVQRDGLHLLQVHNWGNFLEGAVVKLFNPRLTLVHVQQGMEYELTRKSRPFKNRIRRLLRHTFIPLFDAVVACSAETRRYLQREWGAKRPVLIYNSVDTRKFNEQPHSSVQTEGNHHFRVCTVGRMVPVKNLRCLFEAIDHLRRRIPHVRLYHIGGDVGDSAESKQPLIRELHRFRKEKALEEHIVFLGIRDDLSKLLGQFDVFVLTSFSEGLSLSLLEAQACGLPAVVTAVGGNPEVVQHGVNGYLVPSNDPQAVAERLYQLYANPEKRRQMGIAARRIVQDRFDLSHMVRAYQRLYLHLLRKRKPNFQWADVLGYQD
ncbi:MAG: glycosyltransferase family 4 protein [Calditrichaeota bacterium]|nr:glycosyltransferase family 4 protein [Calditrichota bacterium]